MHVFKRNAYGGVDVLSEDNKFVVHLNNDDLKELFEIQQKNYDVDTVMVRIPDWVNESVEGDDFFFADFNSFLYSDDEISSEDIYAKLLSNEKLINKISDEYRKDYDSESDWWTALNKAIASNVSIKGVLGEILCDKHPKEFQIGKWRINVVEKGDLYGENKTLRHEDNKPIVEFYDMSQDKERFPNGQFTGGQYYLETLTTSDVYGESLDEMAKSGVGLELCGGVDAWVVQPGELNVISAWLGAVQNRLELEKTKGEKVVYRGEVDVPHDFIGLAEYSDFYTVRAASEEMLRDKLSSVAEFSSVSVEHFGNYLGGYGFSFSFTTSAEETIVEPLLKRVLNDLKYEAYREPIDNTLENTLSDAQERSRQGGSSQIDERSKDDNNFEIGG